MRDFQGGDVVVFLGASNVTEQGHGWAPGATGVVVEQLWPADDSTSGWYDISDGSGNVPLPVADTEIEHAHLVAAEREKENAG